MADGWPVPRELPPAPTLFVDRDAEFARLTELSQPGVGGSGPRVIVVAGGHGVGKSAIIARWSHSVAERFADGQLYVDLAGHRVHDIASTRDAVAGVLRRLGLRETLIPEDLGGRASLMRSLLAGKRMLILVDDARYATEVQPLIPAAGECCVIVTTRAPLQPLVTAGATIVRLDALDDDHARQLLSEMIGAERVAEEPAAVKRLGEICGGLPIAIRICGGQLAGPYRSRSIDWFVARLESEESRLSRLEVDESTSLQAVFDDAYVTLPTELAALYRTLGVLSIPTVNADLVAAVTGMSGERADDQLTKLVSANLLIEQFGRWRFHELIAVHARQVARGYDSANVRAQVTEKMIRYYRTMVQQMDWAIVPDRLRFAAPPEGRWAFTDPAEALSWFERERLGLLLAMREANDGALHADVWQFAEAMWIAYNNHKHYREAREVYASGVEAAVALGEPAIEARMRQQLARADIELEDYDEADVQLTRAHNLAALTENRSLQSSVLEFRGVLEIRRRNPQRAIDALLEARDGFARTGSQRGVAMQNYMLGRAYTAAGEYAVAIAHMVDALALIDKVHDRPTHGRILLRLGQAQLAAGALSDAEKSFTAAIDVMQSVDAPVYVAAGLEGVADVAAAGQRTDAQREALEAALFIYRAMDHRQVRVIEDRLRVLDAVE